MAYQEFLPDSRLRGLVRAYWQISEVHDAGQEEHRFLPERSVRLTFSAGQSWQAGAAGAALEPMPDAALFGLTLSPQRVVSVGLTRALGVELYPWGARQLFGWGMGQDTVLLHAGHPRLSRAMCALIGVGAWDEARQMVEDWLLGLHSDRGREPGAGVQAAVTLYDSHGRARIGPLAEELGLSPRQLERLFQAEVGLGAKTLARLIRFQEVHNRLWLDPHTPLAALAYELGFADQAHLTREFRSLAHITPGTFTRYTMLRQGQHDHPMSQEGPRREKSADGLRAT